MDPANADEAQGVFVGLLPVVSDWCTLDLPHLTLVYAGTTADIKASDFNELAKDASSLASISNPLSLKVQAREQFGDTTPVDVFRLQPSMPLWAMRRFLEKWNASQFDFNPHVTIGPVGTPVEFPPTYIAFDRMIVAWGKENLTFSLRN